MSNPVNPNGPQWTDPAKIKELRDQVQNIRDNTPMIGELAKDLFDRKVGSFGHGCVQSMSMQIQASVIESKADSMENNNRRIEGKTPDMCCGVSESDNAANDNSEGGKGCIIF